jgi:6-pyruvoyltetrahydropterin/6-carboxytetrahydropterin synthase
MNNTIVSKLFGEYPAAHRQHTHSGHCSYIHGHNWSFAIDFQCAELDQNGFVIDVGTLKPVDSWLKAMFDHTLLLNEDDPQKSYIQAQLNPPGVIGTQGSQGISTIVRPAVLAKIRIIPNCSMEGLAKLTFHMINSLLSRDTVFPKDVQERKVKVVCVTCWEDNKNSVTYTD